MAEFSVNILEEDDFCIVTANELKISREFVDIAFNSHGHWDIYFAPFIIDKFETSLFYRYLSVEETDSEMLNNYSKIFIQLCDEYVTSLKTFSENWYDTQLEKLINEEFAIN